MARLARQRAVLAIAAIPPEVNKITSLKRSRRFHQPAKGRVGTSDYFEQDTERDMQLTLRLEAIHSLFGQRLAWATAPVLAACVVLAGTAASASAASSYDDCAVRILAGRTYIFVSIDDPNFVGDQRLWDTCAQLVQNGYAESISTRTPMASAGNELVCSADAGPAHMHVWAAPDDFSVNVATNICDNVPVENITWWPLS